MTVVPAYRLEGHFADQALNQVEQPPMDAFKERLRLYIRRLLAGAEGSFIDIGERWTMTQTGDPDLNAFIRAVNAADAASPRGIIEDTLIRCSESLPRPDLSARIVILMGDGESRGLAQAMQYVNGVSLGSHTTLLFLWPAHQWRETLAYTTAHEYVHLVRNRLFPRGMAGGRHDLHQERGAGHAAGRYAQRGAGGHLCRRHHSAASPALDDRADAGHRARCLAASGAAPGRNGPPGDTPPTFLGDDDRVPIWTGHAIGYAIVQSYMSSHPDARIASVIGMPIRALLEESGYIPGLRAPVEDA